MNHEQLLRETGVKGTVLTEIKKDIPGKLEYGHNGILAHKFLSELESDKEI